jgi:hypothetical protein
MVRGTPAWGSARGTGPRISHHYIGAARLLEPMKHGPCPIRVNPLEFA